MKKIIAMILVMAMVISVTSCNDSFVKNVLESYMAEEPTEPTAPPSTVATTTTETTAAAVSTGKYMYTLYKGTPNEITLSMDINLDNYFNKSENGLDCFLYLSLATDLGWLIQGKYTADDYFKAVEEDPYQTKIGFENFYTFSYGDHQARFTMKTYEDFPKDFKEPQIREIWVSYCKNDSNYPFFEDGRIAHKDLNLQFDRHYDDVKYYVANGRSACSKDDAILIGYLFWYYSKNAGNSADIQNLLKQFSSLGGYRMP